jgi:hypothetical protein
MTSCLQTFAQERDNLENRLSAYYKTHAPSKLANIKKLASLHAYNQDNLSHALMRKYGKALTLEKPTNSNENKKPYVLFPRSVNHDVVSPPVGKGKPFTSKYTGVTWHKVALGWSANISKNSSITCKACYIGIYDTEKEAAIAFDRSDKKIKSYPNKKLNHIKFPHDF